MIYLITFPCYGAHLHGDESGSVDRLHNLFGSPTAAPNPNLRARLAENMSQPPYTMDEPRRNAVLSALIERCGERKWNLLAAHVRTNHVHLIVDSDATPERVMNDLKSYASRILNLAALDPDDRKRWARHGSTRRLWDRDQVNTTIKYVAEKQGQPMALFVAESS